jgi:serine/threonine protein kinase
MPADRTIRAVEDDRFYELCRELDALPADRRPAAVEQAARQHPAWAQALRDCYRADALFAGGLKAAQRHTPEVPNAASNQGLASMSQLLIQLRNEGRGATPLQVGDLLGQGGWGRVVEAEDPHLGCRVAVKSLSRNVVHWAGDVPVISQPRALARFIEEAQVASQLDHPGVIPIHRLGVDASGAPFFTMKLVRGVTLEEALEVHAGQRTGLLRDKPWDLRRVLTTLERVAEALSYAHHKGVVHRDVKPQNILVGHHGETYLLDWGLARVVSEGRPAAQGQAGWVTTVPRSVRQSHRGDAHSPLVTGEHEVLGTPCYLAPESMANLAEREGLKAYSLDVYSLGAILYRALAGHPPYLEPGVSNRPEAVLARAAMGDPTPIFALAPQAPGRLLALCASSMARDPAQRPPSVDHWLHELRAVLGESAAHAAALARSVVTGTGPIQGTEWMPGRGRQAEPARGAGTEPMPGANFARPLPAPRHRQRQPAPSATNPKRAADLGGGVHAGTDPSRVRAKGTEQALEEASSAGEVTRSGWAAWLPWILLTFALGLWAGRLSS